MSASDAGAATPWVGLREARTRTGLRLVLLRGLPSPWSLAARALFDVKRVPYAPAYRAPDDPPEALRAWTGQDSCPVAVWNDERPRSHWAEILLLTERLAPTPRLVPATPADRARVLGLSHELCGELGLGWCRRLLGMAPSLTRAPDDPDVRDMLFKYGSSPAENARAKARVLQVLGLLDAQLARGAYLGGDQLSALDLYWASFCNVIAPLPARDLGVSEEIRAAFGSDDPDILAACTPALRAHRDAVYRDFLRLPLDV